MTEYKRTLNFRMEPTTEDEYRLVKDFNANFGQKANIKQIHAVLGTPNVLPWYKQWKADLAKEKSVPAHWKELGLTPEMWAEGLLAKQTVSSLRATAAAELSDLARQYQRNQEAINAKLSRDIEGAQNPISRILDLNVDNLSLRVRLDAEKLTGEQRVLALEKSLDTLRGHEIARLLTGEGSNPQQAKSELSKVKAKGPKK